MPTKKRQQSTIFPQTSTNKKTRSSNSDLPVSQDDNNISQGDKVPQDFQDNEASVVHLDMLNKTSWVWEFYRQELRKEEGEWVKYTICKINVLVDKECGRAY